ncbi:MAG TPA: response regulator, partial [Deltaproteobacteria bacterium]|nr:response regulator [Deltaproteobacteria bacterium]
MKKATPAKEKKRKSQTDDSKSLRVLIVEDNEDDTLLVLRDLKKGGFNPVYERVETAAAMKKALKEKQWDIILSDYKLPRFDGIQAINLLRETQLDIPLLIISGTIGEETAVECMRAGALDYVMKNNLTRLCQAIKRKLKEAEARNRQRQAEEALFKNKLLLNETQQIAGVGGWEYDLVNRRISWTDEVYRIYGVSNDFDPNNIEQNIKFYSPDDQKIITQAFWQAVKKGIPYDLEPKFINARGNHLW